MRWMYVFVASVALAQTAPPSAGPPTPPLVAPATPPPAAPPTPTADKPPHAASAADLMRASIEKQRAAVRKQAEAAGATLIPWSPPVPVSADSAAEPACDPVAADVVTPFIESAAKANGLQVALVRAVIEQESAYRPCAVSRKGAQGLMQLMPDTATELTVKDVFDPKENIAAGARYLKQLLDKYKGDNKLALAAYNAGSGAVDAANGVPDIAETRDYVDAILKKLK